VAQDAQTLVLKTLNGEIDMQDRHIATLSNKAVFADNQQKGGYGFFETLPATMNQVVIALNLTHKDPVKRQIFQNKDFRIGLSHALDRQEIIDVVYVSQGEPWQAAPRRETPFYDERMAKQYTEYDLKKANEYLDRAFPQKDGQGFRLGPDGKRIFFVIEFTSATAPDRADALKLVQGYWQKVGVDAQIKEEDRSLLGTRKTANEHDATAWDAGGGLDVILYPYYYFPQAFGSDFARAWEVWYNNPSGAGAQTAPEEPPPAPKRQMELYRQLETTSDPGKQIELMKQVLAIAREEFYTIGLALPPNGYGLVKNNFKNVPKSMPGAYLWPTPAPTNPSQYFIQ
jgi:peptide/nickel transport system substrate-binding protein